MYRCFHRQRADATPNVSQDWSSNSKTAAAAAWHHPAPSLPELTDYRVNVLRRLTAAALTPRTAAVSAAALAPRAAATLAALAALIIPWHDALAPSPLLVVVLLVQYPNTTANMF